MKFIKKSDFKVKNNLLTHIFLSLKDRWFLSTAMIFFTILMALLLITNIKIIEYVTRLLVSKSIIDSSNNYAELALFLKRWNINEDIVKQIEEFFNQTINDQDAFIQDLIRTFFYDNVSYKNETLFISFFNFNLNLHTLIYIMIADISLIVLFAYFVYILSGFVSKSYESKLKETLINKLIDQDLHYFDKNKIGDLIRILVKDSTVLGKQIKEAPVNYLLSGITILIASTMMFNIDWKLASLVFGLLILCLLLVVLFNLITNSATKKIHQTSENLDNQISEKIYSIRLIKSSGTFEKEKEEFSEQIKIVDTKDKKKYFLSEISSSLIVGGIGSFSTASIIFGVLLYYNQTQSLISIMTAFTAGVIVMTMPILQLRQVMSEGPAARVAANNITNILDSEIKIDKFNPRIFNEPVESIEFNSISFKYPDSNQEILKNINIKLEKNHRYAFVGPTGSGKSTIAKLILRFYDPSEGKIIINKLRDLREMNLKSWLDKIGYVDQEPQILSGTIYANIAYGLENISKEAVVSAAKMAKIHDLIMSWPDGYDTVLFERGSQLSGGQKQRLVIARLILKNPEVLIFDEATSALDNIVEKEIQLELEKLMVGRTTISIAHRLSTIKTFDRIFVINPKVGIVQSGTFDELINQPGLFKKLYEISN